MSFRSWQPTAGQAVGHVDRGSQVSIPSLTPLSHLMAQSRSLLALHPAGQQPSSETQDVSMPLATHVAVQVAADPCNENLVHPRLGQVVGQEPGGSHCSPVSTTPLPQIA